MSLEGSLRRNVPSATHVYRPDIIDSLIKGEVEEADGSQKRDDRRELNESSSQPMGTSTSHLQDRMTAKREARREEERLKEAQFQLKMEQRKAEEAARKEQEFQDRYSEVLGGILEGDGIMGEVQYSLNHSQRIKSHKKKGLYDEWSQEVFDKIQGRLTQKVDKTDVAKLEQRLNSQMSDFLTASNTKLGIFLDAIDKSDYDPLKYTRDNAIRVDTSDIRDPLKRDVLKPMYEQQLMEKLCGNSPVTSPRKLKPMGKETLDTKLWGELQITATPCGHAVDKEGNYIVRPMSSRLAEQRKGHIVMDHYDYPNLDNSIADKEMGKRGKGSVLPPGATGEAMSRGLFSLVQQAHLNGTAKVEPVGMPTGDLWLDAKGKSKLAGPDVIRGRLDFKETLQQTGPDPYKHRETAKGDWWLEAKGKGHPPGPEMRRGRKGLTETLQQTTNPYVDGRALGDAWLEIKGKKSMKPVSAIPMREVISSMEGKPDPPPKPRGQGGQARNASHLLQEGGVMTTKPDGNKETSFSRWIKP